MKSTDANPGVLTLDEQRWIAERRLWRLVSHYAVAYSEVLLMRFKKVITVSIFEVVEEDFNAKKNQFPIFYP